MTEPKQKRIAEIICIADMRTDICNMRLGHGYVLSPIEKCMKCEHLKIKYTARGTKYKDELLHQTASWEKNFGTKRDVDHARNESEKMDLPEEYGY